LLRRFSTASVFSLLRGVMLDLLLLGSDANDFRLLNVVFMGGG
jgi:hypothetical protein